MRKEQNTGDSMISDIENRLKKQLPGFSAQKLMAPESRLKMLEQVNEQTKKSGVLLLLYPKNQILHLVFIQRSLNGSIHSGQISFPGGKFDEGDKDLIYTSLRETHEEIGVAPSNIQILGSLSHLYIPVSNYMVYPCVGYTSVEPKFILNQSEVAGILEIPVCNFFREENRMIDFVEVRDASFEAPMFKVNGNKIWGATAMILNEFTQILSDLNFDNLIV